MKRWFYSFNNLLKFRLIDFNNKLIKVIKFKVLLPHNNVQGVLILIMLLEEKDNHSIKENLCNQLINHQWIDKFLVIMLNSIHK